MRGFYTAASGMIAHQRRQQMLTNNMANVQTPGYKEDRSSVRTFPKMLIDRIENNKGPKTMTQVQTRIGEMGTGVYMQEATPNFKQGSLQETGNKVDLALIQRNLPRGENGREQGSLFYTIRDSNNEIRYTKNGSFTVDPSGFLTTREGYYVLNTQNEPIHVANDQFSVTKEGVVVTQAGQNSGQLNVVYIEDPNQLVKEGTLFRLENGNAQQAVGNGAVTYSIEQGLIERSNVTVERTMTEMMGAYRAFEANQKVLQAYDRNLEKTVNEIGRLR